MTIKFNPDSQVVIKRKIRETVDEEGNKIIFVRKEILKEPIDFGSIKNPKNQDVIEAECQIKPKINLGNLFGGII
jgi:hypothetical protein